MSGRAEHSRSCGLALGGLGVLVLLLVVGVAWPWLGRERQYQEEIAQRREQLARYRQILGTLPTLQQQLRQVRNDERLKALYFNAGTPALAGAQLQAQLKRIVAASSGTLTSTQILPVADGEVRKVAVRVQMRGNTEALFDALYRIESARPLLFVDQLSVRAQVYRAARRRKAVRTPPSLTVRLDVYGFVQPGRKG